MIFLIGLMVSFSFSKEKPYSLIPPHVYTNISEINDWTIRGSVANMKSYLRLTNEVTNSFGGVCSRVPTRFQDWAVEIEISAKGRSSGEAFYFFFTKECCPDIVDNRFDGIGIWINTTQTDKAGLSPVYFFNNLNNEPFDYTKIEKVGNLKIRNTASHVRLRITRKAGFITMESTTDSSHSTVFTENSANIIPYGYFSFYATTSIKADNNDLYSFMTVPLSAVLSGESKIDYSSVNRKMLQDNVLARRVMKKKRRLHLSVSRQYQEEADKNSGKLTDRTQNLTDAFRIIKEANSRGMETVTIDSLKNFVEEKVDKTIEKAIKKVELASSRLEETKTDMSEVWSYLKTQLIDLSVETAKTMRQMGDEALEHAKNIKLAATDPEAMKMSIKKINKEEGNESMITNALILICFLELVAYVVFFLVQRQKTHGFKKAD